MLVAVISDIHANLPAFRTVLDDAEAAGAEQVWCLGDVVGYGAHPRECLDLALERTAVCLSGNHDLAVLDAIDRSVFSSMAGAAAEWTREELGESGLERLAELGGSAAERDGIGLYHASPRDPVWEYVISEDLAAANLNVQPEPVALIGHSHIALVFTRDAPDRPVRMTLAPEGTELSLAEGSWLVNPGSAGQPRDGDPRAAWLLLDTEMMTVRFRRSEYPVDEAADAIRAAGLPPELAERLLRGQ